mmetsp:Transcript_17592/g.45006  ORF Transcript_17592/g.45006 Transcript_17592/m.45006 type:complete len:302 (+) Transcript_17592:2310-3215(+)
MGDSCGCAHSSSAQSARGQRERGGLKRGGRHIAGRPSLLPAPVLHRRGAGFARLALTRDAGVAALAARRGGGARAGGTPRLARAVCAYWGASFVRATRSGHAALRGGGGCGRLLLGGAIVAVRAGCVSRGRFCRVGGRATACRADSHAAKCRVRTGGAHSACARHDSRRVQRILRSREYAARARSFGDGHVTGRCCGSERQRDGQRDVCRVPRRGGAAGRAPARSAGRAAARGGSRHDRTAVRAASAAAVRAVGVSDGVRGAHRARVGPRCLPAALCSLRRPLRALSRRFAPPVRLPAPDG